MHNAICFALAAPTPGGRELYILFTQCLFILLPEGEAARVSREWCPACELWSVELLSLFRVCLTGRLTKFALSDFSIVTSLSWRRCPQSARKVAIIAEVLPETEARVHSEFSTSIVLLF